VLRSLDGVHAGAGVFLLLVESVLFEILSADSFSAAAIIFAATLIGLTGPARSAGTHYPPSILTAGRGLSVLFRCCSCYKACTI